MFLNGLCELDLIRRQIDLGFLCVNGRLKIFCSWSQCYHLLECWTRFYLVPRVLDKYVKTEYNSMTHAICFACTTNNYIVHVQVKVRDVMSRINFKISRVIFFSGTCAHSLAYAYLLQLTCWDCTLTLTFSCRWGRQSLSGYQQVSSIVKLESSNKEWQCRLPCWKNSWPIQETTLHKYHRC